MAIRLMLVDDDPSARFLIRTILGEQPGHFEIVAETGRTSEAIGLLTKTDPDVILLDAVMPIVSGYELAGQILAVKPDAVLVLLSAYVDDKVREKAQAVGIRACIDKGDFHDIPLVIAEAASWEPGESAAPG